MTDSEADSKLDWRSWLAILSLVGGILLVLLSLLLPSGVVGHANWSPDEAKQYQAASVKLHSLSHASARPSSDVDQQALHNDLQKAEADYQAIRTKLDSAIDQPKQLAWALRVAGIVFLAVGGFGMYYTRAPVKE